MGFRSVFLIGLMSLMLAVSLLIIAPLSLHLTYGVFTLIGAGMAGFQMGGGNIVLEFGTIEDRPRRLAVTNIAATLIQGVSPLIGGILADLVGYLPVFCVSLVCMVLSVVLLYLKVEEPRFAGR